MKDRPTLRWLSRRHRHRNTIFPSISLDRMRLDYLRSHASFNQSACPRLPISVSGADLSQHKVRGGGQGSGRRQSWDARRLNQQLSLMTAAYSSLVALSWSTIGWWLLPNYQSARKIWNVRNLGWQQKCPSKLGCVHSTFDVLDVNCSLPELKCNLIFELLMLLSS